MKTTVVGSYPVPQWLRGSSQRESLRDAMLAVIKTQELAGIELVADGELYRWDVNHAETNGMIDYFVRPLDGVRAVLTRAERLAWRTQEVTRFRALPAGVVVAPLGHGCLDLWADYQLYRDLTERPKKFTVTSPYMLARTVFNQFYADFESLVMALAEVLREQLTDVDADVVQVDEANVTGNPQDGPLAARAINHVLSGVQKTRAVHLCFGNYGGQTIQRGHYDALIEFLNQLHADHLVLELARRPAEELMLLQQITSRIGLGIGVIDIKDNEIETPSEVARRIDQAAAMLGAERIHYVHPDCGFWMLPRSVADAKMKSLVAGRNLALGQ